MFSVTMVVNYLLVSVITIGSSLSDKILLPSNYSIETLPPTEENSPVLLKASVNLRNILDVVETKQQLR